MTNDFLDNMSDFSYGVLLMTEFAGVVVTWLLHRVHRLMRVTASFLSWLLVVNVFYFVAYYLYAPENLYLYHFCEIFEATVVPACLFLLLGITHPDRLTWRMVTANALPYAVAIVAFLILRWEAIHTAVVVMAMVHAFGVFLYTIHAICEYNRSLLHVYSSLEYIDLRWTRSLIGLFAAWSVLWLMECMSPYEHFDIAYDIIVAVVVAITTYSMVRHAYTLYDIERNMVADVDPGTDITEMTVGNAETMEDNADARPDDVDTKIAPPAPRDTSSAFDSRFEALFAQDRIYLNPLLTIDELARALGSNRTYTSNYINQRLGTTFYSYVNSWRVRHAARLLQDTPLSIEEVAQQSGFNSLTSFRKYFRNVHGLSASEFKKRCSSGQSVKNTNV